MNRQPFARPLAFVLCAGLALCAAPVVRAQTTDSEPRVTAETGASFRQWTVTDSASNEAKISQLYVPFSATIPVGATFDIVAYGAYASTKLDLGEAGAGTLKGITDFRLKGFWRPTNRFFLGAGVNLPIGKHLLKQGPVEGRPRGLSPKHDGVEHPVLHEVEVAQSMWSPIFGFRAKRMGEGLDIDLSAGAAFPLSPTATLGFGAGYILKGEYDFIETEDATRRFKPGAEASASIGLDIRPNEATLIRLDVAGRTFTEDTQSDRKVFQASSQLELDGLVAHQGGGWNWQLHARQVAKGDDTFIEENGDNGVLETPHTAVSSFWASAELFRDLKESLSIGASVEFGSFGKSDLTISDGHSLSYGPALRFGRRGGSGATLRVAGLTGSAENGDIDLSGFDVSGVVSLAF